MKFLIYIEKVRCSDNLTDDTVPFQPTGYTSNRLLVRKAFRVTGYGNLLPLPSLPRTFVRVFGKYRPPLQTFQQEMYWSNFLDRYSSISEKKIRLEKNI